MHALQPEVSGRKNYNGAIDRPVYGAVTSSEVFNIGGDW